MKGANKGDWSEIYVFFKILLDRLIPIANEKLESTNKHLTFDKIIRTEDQRALEYLLSGHPKIVILDKDTPLKEIIMDDKIRANIKVIFNKICASTGRSFEIPEARELMNLFLCTKIKAKSSKKSDIDAVIFDPSFEKDETGFSIKSGIGSASTLLNASRVTNFIYKLSGLSLDSIDEINNLESARKRVAFIVSKGTQLKLDGLNDTFKENLKKVDSNFPNILSDMLVRFYSSKKISTLNEITSLLQGENDYEIVVKRFLNYIALGMVPSKRWDDKDKANGGYLIVKKDGQIVCYNPHNRNSFESYLFKNTKFDTGDSKRNDYGKIYIDKGEPFIKLNLQVRFK